jgi:hypothetical protein
LGEKKLALKILNCMKIFVLWRNVIQSSSFFNLRSGKIVPQLTVRGSTDHGRWERQGMKKTGKGISDNALTKVAYTGLIITSLGGVLALDRNMAMDNALSGLQDKVPPAQIKEIETTKREMGNGYSAGVIGSTISAFSMGYFWGRRAGKKEDKAGPAR